MGAVISTWANRRRGFSFWLIPLVLSCLVTIDACVRIGRFYPAIREVESRWRDRAFIWKELRQASESPPAGIDPREWKVRVLRLSLLANTLCERPELQTVREAFRSRLVRMLEHGLDQGAVEQLTLFLEGSGLPDDNRESPFEEYFDLENRTPTPIASGEGVEGQVHESIEGSEIVSKSTGMQLLRIRCGAGDFYAGKFEVTQGEYVMVMECNPSSFREEVAGQNSDARRLPVERVSWFDAVEFCNKLSKADGFASYFEMSGLQRDDGTITSAQVAVAGGIGYRLPTEVEWQAMKGSTDSLDDKGQANCVEEKFFNLDLSRFRRATMSVGSYKANRLGLHDVIGNVWEWGVVDGAAIEGGDDIGGDGRVFSCRRGGSWLTKRRYCGASDWLPPGGRDDLTGFRVVRSVETANPNDR